MEFIKALEGLKCISCGEYDLAILNSLNLSTETENQNQFTKQQNSFFENLDDILVQNRIDTPTRWSFFCFLSRFGVFKGEDAIKVSNFQIDSAINEFEKISKKDRLLKNLKIFLFGQNIEIPNVCSDKLALELSREILYVATRYGSLYRTLQLLFKPLISAINDIRVFKLLGYSAFTLYPSAPPKEFWDIRLFTTNEQFRDAIYYSQDLPFLSKLQSDYIDHFQYPNDFPGSLTFNSSSCSLLMTSIFKNVHFVDLLSQLFKEKIHKLEIGLIPEIARVAPSFIPFLFAAYQPFIYLSPQIFLSLITAKLPSVNNAKNNFCYKNNKLSDNIIELQQRFINDLLISKLVIDLNNESFSNNENEQTAKKPEKKKSFFSKKKKTEDTIDIKAHPRVRRDSDLGLFIRDFSCPVNEILKGHSIPFLFNGYFRKPEFLEFENKKFYVFSDEEVQKDFDFIHIYNAIADTIELLQTTKEKTRNMILIQRSLLSSIDQNLQLIREPNLLTKVAIDIFSLIFIKEDKNENSSNFLCQNLGIAYLIIKILKKFFTNDRFIKFGAILVSQKALSMPKNQIWGISTVFNSNLNFLLNIIIKQNWKEAYEVALLLSGNQKNNLDHRSQIYWRAYILSNSVYNLITGKSCSIECEQFKEDLNLEISVSSSIYNTDDCINYALSLLEKQSKSEEEKQQKLALITNINKIREQRKKIEVEDLFSPLRDSYWIDVEPAVVNLEMFPSEFFTNNLFERYEIPLKKSKLLFNFVNFFNIFFNCSNSNDNNNNINVKKSFAFSPKQALSSAFNNGKIELAEQMASKMNLDLFEFAMRNQKSFEFTPNVVEYFGSKYPLECIEIYHFLNKKQIHLGSENLTKYIKSNEKVEKIINYLNQDKSIDSNTTLEEPLEAEFIELIKSAKQGENLDNLYKEFDDYLYKINHSRISQIVISNFENINKDVALYLLDIVSYAIDTNSLNENVKNLLFKKEIEKVISKEINEDDKIVENLIQNNRFDLATKFIELSSQSQQEKDKIVIQIMKNLLNSKSDKKLISSQINYFVSGFDNSSYLYELIASEIQDKISFISEICPDSIRPSLTAFSSLPESIRSKSSLADKSTISRSICEIIRENKEYQTVFLLNKENSILIDDEGLRSIVEELSNSCANIDDFIEYSSHLSTLSDNNKEILMGQNSKRVMKEMHSIKIDSIESEFNGYLAIQKLWRFNRICKLDDNTSSILKAYRLLLIESPFYFNHIPYSIQNEDDRNRNNLFSVLIKVDLDPASCLLPNELLYSYTKEKVEIMLKLGRFDDALHVLNVNKQFVYEMDDLFLCPFLHKQVYQSNLLPKISNLSSNLDKFFTQIKTVSNSESDLSNSMNSILSNLLDYKEFVSHCKTKDPSSPYLSFCSDFCERFSSKDSFFRFCIRRGAMTTVVSKFMALDDSDSFKYDINNSTTQLFVNSLVECSIEYDKLQLLKKEMSDYSKYNPKNSVKVFWRYLADFCEKHEMGFLLLEVSEILSLKDKIALSYIDIFAEIDPDKVNKKLQYLEKARTVLYELINEGAHDNNNNNNNNNGQQPNINSKSSSKEKEPNKNSKIRRIRSSPSKSSNSFEFIESVTDSSNSQQSSSILFDPDEFNNRNPDEFCEYDITSNADDDDQKKAHKSKNSKKTKIHYGLSELLKIADLLFEFLPLFIELNAPFPDSMNLFNGSVACLPLGGFFLRNGKFDFVQKISHVMRVPKKAIVNAFFEFITDGKSSNLSQCMKHVENTEKSSESQKINQNPTEKESENANPIQKQNESENASEKQNENANPSDKQNENENENANPSEKQNESSSDKQNENENFISNDSQAPNSNENSKLDENLGSNEKKEATVDESADENKASNSTSQSNLAGNSASNKDEIIQFVEDTKNEGSFWNSDNFYNVHLYVEKLSLSQNFELIPLILEKLLPEEKFPSFLIEFDFLNQAFKIFKEKNIETELIPVIAARASALGDYEVVKKCEEELGIKPDENPLLEIDN